MMPKRKYERPELARIILDRTISLVMMTAGSPPGNPHPRGGTGGKGNDAPFQSPFGDKPFG